MLIPITANTTTIHIITTVITIITITITTIIMTTEFQERIGWTETIFSCFSV